MTSCHVLGLTELRRKSYTKSARYPKMTHPKAVEAADEEEYEAERQR
jgi:hypothetical protein